MGKKITEHKNVGLIFPDRPGRKTETSYTMYGKYDSFIPNYTPFEIYRILEELSTHDDCVSKIKIDFINTVLSGLDIKCKNEKVKEEIIDFLENQINKNNGGINGLIRRWAGQAFVYDAICGEIIIDKDRKGIEDVVVFDPKTVVFKVKNKKYILCQISYKDGTANELPPLTCFYLPIQLKNDTPYSIPRLTSSIHAVEFKNSIEKGIKNQVEHWGFNTVVGKLKLNYFRKKVDESDADYDNRIKNALNTYQEALMNKKSSQPILTTSVFDTDVLDGVDNADDIAGVNSLVYSKLANSLKVDKMMLNQGDFNTDVYNTVPYKNFLKQVEQAQKIIKIAIDKIVNLYMLLKGIKEDIEINFILNDVNDEFKAAQAEQMKTRATVLKWQNGFIDSNQAAREVGYDKAAIELKPWELEVDKRNMNGTGGGDNGNG